MKNINEKHKAVVDEYLSNGLNLTQAYKTVYKCSDRTANVRGPLLMKRDDFKEYLEERQKELEAQRVISIFERKKVLEEIIKEGRPKEKIAAIELLNKMENIYKNEITLKHQDITFFDNLSIEELKNILGDDDNDEELN